MSGEAVGLRARLDALFETDEPDLFEGALVVASLIDPGEDLEAARSAVAALAGRVREGIRPGEAAHASLRRVLFEEEGFGGDTESYDQPTNSSVARVLARRRGMPITLSIAVMEVARVAGLHVTGVGLPGHFVVGGPDLPEGMYLDPFDGGELHDRASLERRIGAIFGAPVALTDGAVAPDPPRAILARVLLNLRRSFERRDRWEEALAALELSEALEPGNPSHRRERGLLYLKTGRTREALDELEAFAGEADGEEAEAVRRLMMAVRGEAVPAAEPSKKTFTLEEARALMPEVQRLTAEAVEKLGRLPPSLEEEREEILREWAREVEALGAEIKGLWLVDFDSGAGYYCWKYPEPGLGHFHAYEEGFGGRIPLA